MTPEEIAHQKEIQYYASSVNAWFNTSLEHDKSILVLAAGGIGLLITLLTTVGLSSAEALALYIVAIICFLVALISVLVVFRQNRTHIENILNKNNCTENDPILAKADLIALWAFGMGVVFAAIIGVGAAINSHSLKGKSMSKDHEKTVPLREIQTNVSNLQPATESFNGVAALQKSFNGAANLQCQPVASTAAPVVANPVSPAPSNAPNKSDSGK